MISPRDDISAGLLGQLARAARGSAQRTPTPQALDYPFDRPNRFAAAQIARLDEFAARAAQAVAQLARQMLQVPVTFKPARWQQLYARSLRQAGRASLRHVAALSIEEGANVGFVGLSAATASQWLARLLGGCESAEPEQDDARQLSDLERDLLMDIAAALAEALRKAAGAFGGQAFSAERQLSCWPDALAGDDVDEYCLLEFDAEGGQAAGLALLLTAQATATLAGETDPAKLPKPAKPPMLGHVEQVPVEARAMLSTSLTVREVMALAPGDVVVLDQRTDEPIELEVDGRAVLRGHLARQQGQFALQCAELCTEKKTALTTPGNRHQGRYR